MSDFKNDLEGILPEKDKVPEKPILDIDEIYQDNFWYSNINIGLLSTWERITGIIDKYSKEKGFVKLEQFKIDKPVYDEYHTLETELYSHQLSASIQQVLYVEAEDCGNNLLPASYGIKIKVYNPESLDLLDQIKSMIDSIKVPGN